MSPLRWLGVSILLFCLSAVLSLFLPNGFNWLMALFGENPVVITPTIRLYWFLFIFLFLRGVETTFWARSEFTRLFAKFSNSFDESITRKLDDLLSRSLLRFFWPSVGTNSEQFLLLSNRFHTLMSPLVSIHASLLPAYSVLIERRIQEFENQISRISTTGCTADIATHIAISRRLTADASAYLQIQRRAFRAPEEWTQEWCEFVTDLSRQRISCQYIVLADRTLLVAERERLCSMEKYLRERRFVFGFCDAKHVEDSLGGTLPTDDVVEVFDNNAVKLAALPEGKYRGGIHLNLILTRLAQRDDLRKMVECVVRGSERDISKMG